MSEHRSRRLADGFIDFESLRFKLSKAQSELKYKIKEQKDAGGENNFNNATSSLIKNEMAELKKEISQLEAVLATEPPKPILPPSEPLTKISGVIEEFTIMKVQGYFQDKEYSSPKMEGKDERNQLGGLVLAVIGDTSASAATLRKSERMGSACDFVRGKINGIPFYGWLGKTNVKVGDYVNFPAIMKNSEYVIYAISSPETRTISMTPRCAYGRRSEFSFELKSVPFLIAFFFLLICVLAYFNGGSILDVFELTGIFSAIFFAALVYAFFTIRKNPKPSTKLAESIFSTLGFPDPKSVDLPKITRKTIKKGIPTTVGRDMPSSKAPLDYFYYY